METWSRPGGARETARSALADERKREPRRHRTQDRSTGDRFDRSLAKGLAWFSIVLGSIELVAPHRLARLAGLPDTWTIRSILRLMGVREIIHGWGILARPSSPGWLWSRVGGDALDLSVLGVWLARPGRQPGRIFASLGAVTGMAVIDVLESVRLSRQMNGRSNVPASLENRRTRAPGSRPVHVKRSVTINRPAEEVYAFWRDLEKLPTFMQHLIAVEVQEDGLSRWRARAPAGMIIEWTAELMEDVPNERIAWRSAADSPMKHRGSVVFRPAPADRGTEVQVDLWYDAPGGRLGATVAKLLGEEPALQVEDDLRALKQVLETGEVTRSEGSPGGRIEQHPGQPPADRERQPHRQSTTRRSR